MGIEKGTIHYVCDLSGLASPALEDTDSIDEDDPMMDSPSGWTQVVVRTRIPNPDWTQAQTVYAGARAQVRKEMKDEKDPTVVQLALFALQQQMIPIMDVPQFLMNEAALWVAPAHIQELMRRLDPEVAEIFEEENKALADLDDDFDDFEEEEEEEELEEVPLPEPSVAQKSSKKKKKAAAG
jgi:hypothetical protein|tara:strand:- start:148 stop:693 length:546 start_codon:yes stop_codon:yes gene_type:complete